MSLPDTLIARLIQTVRANDLSGAFVMLGRQEWVGARRSTSAELMHKVMEEHLPGLTEDDLKNPDDSYSETFFRRLGFADVDSMDVSDFEGASIIQDIGAELDPDLLERFDVVYDGGTCEHVFDLPTAYRNIDRMLKPGGTLIGHSPCNNWTNHGFFQICPETVYGFWEKAMGYRLLHLRLQPLRPRYANQVVTTSNPNETGKRPRILGDLPVGVPLILDYAVQKPLDGGDAGGRVFQTDYVQKWTAPDAGD